MNILLRRLQFVRVYIDNIVVKSRFLAEHVDYLPQLFELSVNKNISLNFINIFLIYFEITLLEQRINVFDLTTTKNILKAIVLLKISKTFAKFEIYLKLIDYIKQYIHYYVSLFRFLQDFKTSLLKTESINEI